MGWIHLIVIGLLLAYIGQWVIKYIIKPGQARKQLKRWLDQPHIKYGYEIINKLYHGVNPRHVSNLGRKKLRQDSNAFVYGEIDFVSFAEILDIAKPANGGVFYDLGSGAGKAVFAAALLHNYEEVKGIELLPALYQLSCNQLNKFNQMPEVGTYFPQKNTRVTFVNGDILETDLSDANTIFINATAFFGDLWNSIVAKIDSAPSGTKVILTSRELDPMKYQLIDANMRLMSWGVNSVYIYEKR